MPQQKKKVAAASIAILVMGLVVGLYLADPSSDPLPRADAADGRVTSPTEAAPERYVYYPGTEELKPNEIRIVARGTGMPSARRSQAATCFLVELGDDEKFLFDIGSGSHANIQSLMIPSDFLTKILHYAFTHRPLGRLGLAMGW